MLPSNMAKGPGGGDRRTYTAAALIYSEAARPVSSGDTWLLIYYELSRSRRQPPSLPLVLPRSPAIGLSSRRSFWGFTLDSST